jgi:methionine-rich copper-binding protein CopC
MSLALKQLSFAGAALSLLSLGGCGGDSMNMGMSMPTGSTAGVAASAALAPTFDSIQADVFTPICSGCHSGANPAANLALDAAQSYNDLINVPSTEQPAMVRIKPFEPTNSYLIIHMQNEGDGAPPADIPVIAQWITNGAMPSMMMMGGMGGMGGMGMSADFQVSATRPSTGDVLLASPSRITVGFSDELDASSVNTTSVRLERVDDTADAAGTMSTVPTVMSIPEGNARALILTPSSALAPGHYQVVLEAAIGSDLRSLLGSALSAPAPDSSGVRIVTRFSVASPASAE